MSEELKPCPFCNQPARQEKQRPGPNGDRRGTVTGCFNLLCKVMPMMRHEDDQSEAAIAAWNTRTPPRVRELEWGDSFLDIAETPFSTYGVKQVEDGRWIFYRSSYPYADESDPIYKTEDDAKAAAKADFARRVHACMGGYDD